MKKMAKQKSVQAKVDGSVPATQSLDRKFGGVYPTAIGGEFMSLGGERAFKSVDPLTGTKQITVSRPNRLGGYDQIYLSKAQIEAIVGFGAKWL